MAIKTYSKKKDGNKKLSANFTVSEFACKDGSDTILIDDKLVSYLQKIRYHFKKPVKITSAYRNAAYNRRIGGASSSYHTKGQAADIVISGVRPLDIAKYAESIDVKGIGCYNDDKFNHIDTRSTKFFWYNQSNTPTSTFGGGKTTTYQTIKRGSTGQVVKTLQTKLKAKGYSLSVDGDFGTKTENAVKDFQKKNKLTADGIVGPKTWSLL